jgi:hypothetical protein
MTFKTKLRYLRQDVASLFRDFGHDLGDALATFGRDIGSTLRDMAADVRRGLGNG